MIASLDVRTLAFVGSLVFMSVSAILLLVFLTRRVYAGFGYWLLWQSFITLGVLIFALRDPDPPPTMLFLTAALLLIGPALLFHGMERFYAIYTSRVPVVANYLIVAIAMAIHAYFSFLEPSVDARVAIYSVTRAVLLMRCALEPLRIAGPRRSPSFWSLIAIMALVSANDLHHAWLAALPGPVADPSGSDSIRRALVAAVVADVLAGYVLLLLNSERLEAELRAAQQDIEMLARTDSLTGLWNRRHFEDTIAAEIERARRYGTPLALLALDADHFKRINDEFGHHAGDAVLRELARLLTATTRRSDLLCRWGGEEFMVLAPDTGCPQAAAMAEKIRLAVAGHDLDAVGGMTVSVGVGELLPGESTEAWVRRVDAALYDAKQGGRNRVAVAGAHRPAAPGPGTASAST